jgi:hypothetical protein
VHHAHLEVLGALLGGAKPHDIAGVQAEGHARVQAPAVDPRAVLGVQVGDVVVARLCGGGGEVSVRGLSA